MQNRQRGLIVTGVVGLLAVLVLQLGLSVRRESPTWDEGNHIFAGYRSWTHADFGLNPEPPSLVKLLATAPLLSLPLQVSKVQARFFLHEGFLDRKDFLFHNDADTILFRTYTTASILTLLLAILGFLATREMLGTGATFIALPLLVFEPNLLAYGALVTTDAGLSCFLLFATIYAFCRTVKAPSPWRVAVGGVAAGLTLASKHSGIGVVPMLLLLTLCEMVRNRAARRDDSGARAIALAPDSVSPRVSLGDALAALDRPDEARSAYTRALELATTVEPDSQKGRIPVLKGELAPK